MQKELQARDLTALARSTGNIYKSVLLTARLAEQIRRTRHISLLGEQGEIDGIGGLHQKITESDEAQALISKWYEAMPKPIIQATEEFLEGGGADKLKNTETEGEEEQAG